MPIIDMTRYGACPFCGCRQLRHDRIPPDRVAIWCGYGASFDDAADAFNKFNFLNMPIWKYKDEHCNTLLRIFMPRISTSCIAVILEDCMDKIECLEITEKELEHID